MARARSIKPGFFTNEKLAELAPTCRLCYAGLWTLADRSGRLEDRPKRIKALIFPYDNVNVDKMLSELQIAGFIVRYEVGNNSFICIPSWSKHQNPHVKEATSTIPAPCEHGARPGNSGTSRADSLFLDSLNPEPLTLNPESGTELVQRFKEIESAWMEPCPGCGQQFPVKERDQAARQWMSLVDRGVVTETSFPAILEGLTRWRASEQWHKGGGQFVPSMASWLGFSKNGTPAEPRWNDHPVPQRESEY